MFTVDLSSLNNTKYEDLLTFVQGTLNLVISFSALLAVVFLIWAGIQYITSRGEGEKAEKATKSIIYALVGLVVCFIAPLIITFVVDNIAKA